jgi:hypothetical protein
MRHVQSSNYYARIRVRGNRKWGKDFWNNLVGPTLGVDMETWIRGKIPPTIDSYDVHKIMAVKFIDSRPLGAPWTWPEIKDHSKWGISMQSNWICVGDINRMILQENRGGGIRRLWFSIVCRPRITSAPRFQFRERRDLVSKRAPSDRTASNAIRAPRLPP